MKIDTPEFNAAIDDIEHRHAGAGPDIAFLTLSTCLGNDSNCGWTGWLLEAAFDSNLKSDLYPIGCKPVPSVNNQICPSCKGTLFRTGLTRQLTLAAGQPDA